MLIKVLTNQNREIVINSEDLTVQNRNGVGKDVFGLNKDEYIVHCYIVEESE